MNNTDFVVKAIEVFKNYEDIDIGLKNNNRISESFSR